MFFFFIILLFLIKQFSFNFINSQVYIHLNIKNSDYFNKIVGCFKNYSNVSIKLLTKCIINETKHDIDSLIEILKNETMLDKFKKEVQDEIVEHILSVLEKNNETLLNDTIDSLKYKDNLNLTLFDYIQLIMTLFLVVYRRY